MVSGQGRGRGDEEPGELLCDHGRLLGATVLCIGSMLSVNLCYLLLTAITLPTPFSGFNLAWEVGEVSERRHQLCRALWETRGRRGSPEPQKHPELIKLGKPWEAQVESFLLKKVVKSKRT